VTSRKKRSVGLVVGVCGVRAHAELGKRRWVAREGQQPARENLKGERRRGAVEHCEVEPVRGERGAERRDHAPGEQARFFGGGRAVEEHSDVDIAVNPCTPAGLRAEQERGQHHGQRLKCVGG
jgi:hypothetical protein